MLETNGEYPRGTGYSTWLQGEGNWSAFRTGMPLTTDSPELRGTQYRPDIGAEHLIFMLLGISLSHEVRIELRTSVQK